MDKLNKYKELVKYCNNIFVSNNIEIASKNQDEVIEQCVLYVDSIIFNIVSLFCIIAIINNTDKISEKTIEIGKKYIESTCKISYNTKGGYLGSASYMGIEEKMYNANNSTADVLFVDPSKGIARPAFNMTTSQKGGAKKEQNVSKYVKYILEYHNIKVSKSDIKKELLNIINFHINCFVDCMKKYGKPITCSAFKKIIKSHKIMKKFANN